MKTSKSEFNEILNLNNYKSLCRGHHTIHKKAFK